MLSNIIFILFPSLSLRPNYSTSLDLSFLICQVRALGHMAHIVSEHRGFLHWDPHGLKVTCHKAESGISEP